MAKKAQTISAKIPQTRADAEAEMRALGEIRIRIAEIDNTLKEDSQKLIQSAKDKAEPLIAKAKMLEGGLVLYAAAHRKELTDNNKSKRGKLLSGHFEWRQLPPKVSTRGVAAIIAFIQTAKGAQGKALSKFLRTKVELNKEAMLADPALAKTLNGVSIGSEGERLEITIYEQSLEA